MLPELQLQQTNRPMCVVQHWLETDSLELSPPYQRGDVWGYKRRVNFIRSLLMGVPIPSVIINDRLSADFIGDKPQHYAVIDGKQRLTTIKMFVKGTLLVPGEWFDLGYRLASFDNLSRSQQRRFENHPMPFSEGRLKTIEREQEVFELVNFGGLRQGEVDAE